VTEIEELRQEIAALQKLVEAVAFGLTTERGEDGKLRPYTGPCIYEARDWNGHTALHSGTGRAWCRVHGFDCPNMRPTR
jgi:hypothetical protein